VRPRALLAGLTVLAAGFAAAPAAAGPGVLTVTPLVVHRGGAVQIQGSATACALGNKVTITSPAFFSAQTAGGVPAVITNVGLFHSFRTSARIRVRLAPGIYGITARCGGGTVGAIAHLHVVR
jgi:hypothetical protein